MDGFTLTEFAFPVAPDDLDGFTVDGFAWVGGPEPPSTGPVIINATWSDYTVTAIWGD